MKVRFLTALLTSLMVSPASADNEISSIIKRSLKGAVLKVDVTANIPVFDENNTNLCNSAGTAFLVNENYAVTANHVLDVDPRCKGIVILLRSFPAKTQWLATRADTSNDVALLHFDSVITNNRLPCSLLVDGDGFGKSGGIKFGIPGSLYIDPQGTTVDIGEKDGGFEPLVTVTPATAELGESGGPIIYNMHVVGLLKSRHQKYSSYSFMIPNEYIRNILFKNNVKSDQTTCNPVYAKFTVNENHTVTMHVDFNGNTTRSFYRVFRRSLGDTEHQPNIVFAKSKSGIAELVFSGASFEDFSRKEGQKNFTKELVGNINTRLWDEYAEERNPPLYPFPEKMPESSVTPPRE
ncbi:hypothetical protein C8J32_1209 [Rhizobium sp. PP-CC-3A-592]|nr:hypothetical protein C8J32_1209 [Rhizobium sp. PP-CC-3A-592]